MIQINLLQITIMKKSRCIKYYLQKEKEKKLTSINEIVN